MLSLAAAALYCLVAFSCALAAGIALRHRQMPWHLRIWMILAVLFVVLAIFRVFAIEEILREYWRFELHLKGTYEERRDFQRPIVAAIIIVGATTAGWWIFRVARNIRGRRNIAITVAKVSGAAMAVLLALRLISLHAIDALLYGPAKLNWIVDIGASLLVLGSALAYSRIVRSRS